MADCDDHHHQILSTSLHLHFSAHAVEMEKEEKDQDYWHTLLQSSERIVNRWDPFPDPCYSSSSTSSFSSSPPPLSFFIWEEHPKEAPAYLEAVDKLVRLISILGQDDCDAHSASLVDRAEMLLQICMSRLEEEFKRLLERNSVPVDPLLYGFFSSSRLSCSVAEFDGDGGGSRSCSSDGDADVLDNSVISMIMPPEVSLSLRAIAGRMVAAGYGAECCHVYIGARKPVLEESLARLGILEKVTMEEMQRMPWEVQQAEMALWVENLKLAVGVLFAGEKELCAAVFDVGLTPDDSIVNDCFADIAKGAMAHLLNFCVGVAVGHRSPEKLFKILDMFEALQQQLPDIDSVFSGAACVRTRLEVVRTLTHLGKAAAATLAEFEHAVRRESARNPVLGGAIHPMIRYAMNYLKFLADYADVLNMILLPNTLSPTNNNSRLQDPPLPPVLLSDRVSSLMHTIEIKIEEKSKLYKDPALGNIFLMNSIHYIVQKVKDSDIIRVYLGEDWMRRQSSKLRQYHKAYQRASWKKVLGCLKDEGIHVSGSFPSSVSKTVLKDRFRSFNSSFEEVHRTQSSWIVSDSQLCTELRLSIGEMLLPAYSSFVGRFQGFLDSDRHLEKYIKYSPEDIDSCLNDLFSGSTITSSNSYTCRRRSSFSQF